MLCPYLRGEISSQVRQKALEWAHWDKFLSVAEYSCVKSGKGGIGKVLVIDASRGAAMRNSYDSVEFDHGEIHVGGVPFFWKCLR